MRDVRARHRARSDTEMNLRVDQDPERPGPPGPQRSMLEIRLRVKQSVRETRSRIDGGYGAYSSSRP
jgi:hypothetical protein